MGLNFLGLGFSLGAQDKGLAAAIKDTSSGLMDISKSVVGIGLASMKMIIKPPDFGPSIGLAQTLANDVKLTTTGMEAFGVAASKATSAGLAGLNLTDKEFRKAQGSIASTAFSMNTDVGAVTKSFAALQQAGVDVKKVGFKSFEQYQKFIEVTGADSTAFAASLGTMSKQMGMSDDAVRDSVTAVASIGKKFNIGREAVAGMAATVKILNENSNLLPQNWSPAKMGKFLKGTTVVAGALTSIGYSADEAMAASQGLTKGLLAGNKGMADLYAGVKSELPQAFSVMTENFGDANKAFEMLQEDPQQFMLKMGDMVKKVNGMNLKPEAMNRFRSQMESTFGPEIMATFTKQGFGKLEPALKSAGDAMKDQGKVVDQLASKYQDGRTYAERFAIVQDQMHTALKKIPGVMADGVYLDKYRQQTKGLVAEMTNLAGKGGIVGKATTMLIEFANRGVGGALAAHTKWGLALSEGIKLMQPMLQYLPAMKMAFTALASPIGIVVGALAGLYFLFKDLAKGKDSIVGPMLKKFAAEAPQFYQKVVDFAKDIFKTVYDVLSKVDWGSVIKTVSDAFMTIFSTVHDVIFDVLNKIDWNKVGQVLGVILSKAADIAASMLRSTIKFAEKILQWLGDVDWGNVGDKLMGYILKAVDPIVDAIGAIFMNLPTIVYKAINGMVDLLVGALSRIEDYLVKKFPEAAKPIVFIVEMLKAAVKIVGGGLKLAFDIVWETLKKIWGLISSIGSAIATVAGGIKDAASWASNMAGKVSGFFSGIGSSISNFFSGSSSMSDKTMNDMVKQQQAMLDTIRNNTAVAMKRAKDARDADLRTHGVATDGYVKTIEGSIIKSTDSITKYTRDAAGNIKTVFVEAGKYAKAMVGGEVFESLEKMQSEIVDMYAKTNLLKKGSDEWNAAMEAAGSKADDVHIDYLKKFGVRYDVMIKANNEIQGQYAVQKTLLEDAKKSGDGYYNALIDMQTKASQQTGQLRLQWEQLTQAGKTGTKEWIDAQQLYFKSLVDGPKAVKDASDIINGTLSKSLDQFVKDSMDKANAAERAAYVLAEATRRSADTLLSGLPKSADNVRQVVQKMLGDIAAAEQKDMTDFMTHTDLKGKALDDAMANMRKKYEAEAAVVTKVITDKHDNLMKGIDASAIDALSKLSDHVADVTKKVDAATAANATEIQKVYGQSADKAVESIGQIGAINPKIFANNIAVIKTQYVGLLNVMDTQGKKIMDNTTKSFNALWKTMNDGWTANTKLLQTFTDSAADHVQQYWDKVMSIALASVDGFIKLTKQIETGLAALARTMNIMDLLASPDQITSWAASVVSALSYAFRTGGAADAMISASYNKALAMASEIQQNAGPATPDTAKMQASPTSSAITAAQALLASINRPTWATDKHELIPTQLDSINQTLIATLQALQAAGEAKAAGKTKPPPKPRI